MIHALHGFTGCRKNWNRLGQVDHTLSILGHSSDAPAQGGESFSGEVQRLAALLPTWIPHLVGYSLGARLSLAIALAYPERIGTLTLIGVNPGIQNPKERELRVEQDQAWIDSLEREGMRGFVDRWQALPMWKSQRVLPAEIQERQREQRLAHDATQLARSLAALGTGVMPPMWSKLEDLSMPLHLIVGEQDSKYRDIAASMLDMLPKAKLSVIQQCGHNPVLEAPDTLAQLLLTPPTNDEHIP